MNRFGANIKTWITLIILALPLWAMAQPAPEVFVIETKRPLSSTETEKLKKRYQFEKLERLSPYRSSYFDRIYRAEGFRGQDALLQSDALIHKVEVSNSITLQSADPLLSYQWHLNNTGHSIFEDITDIKTVERKGVPGTDIGWLKARNELEKRLHRDVRVAVIDSGLDYEHEEIVEQLYKNEVECRNGKPLPGVPKDDNDNNGYKGDCIGINLVAEKAESSNKPKDDLGHGTHVAGIMAATPDNGIGIAGLSGRIKILPIKVYSEKELRNAKPVTDRIAEAILYATQRGVDVINLSVGWPISQNKDFIRNAILEAQSKGIIFVAAAGNNSHNGPVYPCAYKKVICVGSVTVDGQLSNFSNYGPQVDIVAPGSRILSLFPKTMIPKFFSAKGYEYKSGTSQASPIVAGVAALLKGAFPNESAAQIRARILAAAKPLPGLRTAGGLLRLDDSLLGNFHRKNSVEFKEVELAVIQNGNINVNLPIENFTTNAAPAQLKVVKAGPQVAIQNINVQTISAQIAGKVTDLSFHHEWPVTLNLDGTEYEIILPLIRGDAAHETHIALPDGVDALAIRTLYDLEYNSPTAETSPFYFKVVRAENGGIDLQVLELQGKSLQPLFQKNLNETQFLGGGSMDVDGDGVRDFLFFAYHPEKTKIGNLETDVLRMSLYYLNRKGEGVYGGSGAVTMIDDNNSFNFPGLLNFKNVSFVRSTLENGQTIMLPSVIELGIRGPQDQSKEDRRSSPAYTNHIYYFETARDTEGNLAIRTRTLNGAGLEEELRKKLKLYFYDPIQPMMHIVQTPEMRAAGKAQYLLMAGKGEQAKTLLATLSPQNKISWEVIDTGINVQGYNSNSVWRVGAHNIPNSGMAAFGLISMFSFDGGFWDSVNQTFKTTFQMVNPDPTEEIARVMQIFEMNDEKYIVYESTSLLNVLRVDSKGRHSLSSALINRSQFFNQFFSQIASSLAISSTHGYRPGIFIDNSQINAASIHSWDVAGTQLTAPISLTWWVPNDCKAMNPIILKGHYHYVLSCKNSQSLRLTPVTE